MIDLDAYFARIGYAGPRTPTLGTLRDIHALHPAAIPFENLDPLLDRPVPLDLPSVQAKLVGSRRGGYCFEHNALLKAVLEALGFSVTGLAARVVWMAPPDRPPGPRTHMLLKVDLEGGTVIADVGFGGHLVSAPLRLVPEQEQTTPAAVVRYRAWEAGLVFQVRLPAGWHDAYRFTLEAQAPIDYEVANWFTATHPASRFRNNLIVERLTPELRSSLSNRRLTRRFTDGRVEQLVLAGPDDLVRVLAVEFELDPPPGVEAVFDRLPVG